MAGGNWLVNGGGIDIGLVYKHIFDSFLIIAIMVSNSKMWLSKLFGFMTDSTTPNYNLLSLFGMDKASEEEKEEFLTAATHAVLTAVVGRIEKKLPEDKREAFYRLFEAGAPDEEKAAFFKTYVPDFKDVLVEELARFNREAIEQNKKIDTVP